MSDVESIDLSGKINRPEYSFVKPDTILFLTGAPLSGKSTVAPLVAATITDCTIQNMDIIRILAQERELKNPQEERNPFVMYGSCDSYLLVGDGSYSPQSLVAGYSLYARAVTDLLEDIIPKLENQGAQRVIFEGVQLTPEIVTPFLTASNKLILLTASADQLSRNLNRRYGEEATLLERYSVDKLLILQQEILRQGRQLAPDKVFFIDNSTDYLDTTKKIIRLLLAEGVIV